MQQPELGRRLTALRKEKNLTQEELVEKSHVSVRTIQRIEAGEVLPRTITVKILLEALGESYDSFLTKQNQMMETQKSTLPTTYRNTLLIAVLAGAVYLISEIILGTMDIAWFTDGPRLGISDECDLLRPYDCDDRFLRIFRPRIYCLEHRVRKLTAKSSSLLVYYCHGKQGNFRYQFAFS